MVGNFTLPGRSRLFVRNVGHLMTTPAVRLPDGGEAPEGILDGIVTSLIGLHDLKVWAASATAGPARSTSSNPRCTGPRKSDFTNRPVRRRRGSARPARATRIKIGVMDEERRTIANLAACIAR